MIEDYYETGERVSKLYSRSSKVDHIITRIYIESQKDLTRLRGCWLFFGWLRDGVGVDVDVAVPVVVAAARERDECLRPNRKNRQKKITSSSSGCCCCCCCCGCCCCEGGGCGSMFRCCWYEYEVSGGDRVIRSERFDECVWLMPWWWLLPSSGDEYAELVTIAGLLPVLECRSGLLLLTVLPLLL